MCHLAGVRSLDLQRTLVRSSTANEIFYKYVIGKVIARMATFLSETV